MRRLTLAAAAVAALAAFLATYAKTHEELTPDAVLDGATEYGDPT